MRLKGVVRYDGTAFAGWQIQPGQPTVQQTLTDAFSTIAGARVGVTGASRTDAGVHALAQVFHVNWPDDAPPDRLRHAVSRMAGPDIRVESLEPAAEKFHAAFSSTGKRYAYVFCGGREPDPFLVRYAWHLEWAIDRGRVDSLAQRLAGEHDFGGFCGAGSKVKDTVRTIRRIEVLDGGVVTPADAQDVWRIEVEGNGFLYKMVRNIVGTLIEIARGHQPESFLDERLAAPRPYRGYTAPAHGLFLMEVLY